MNGFFGIDLELIISLFILLIIFFSLGFLGLVIYKYKERQNTGVWAGNVLTGLLALVSSISLIFAFFSIIETSNQATKLQEGIEYLKTESNSVSQIADSVKNIIKYQYRPYLTYKNNAYYNADNNEFLILITNVGAVPAEYERTKAELYIDKKLIYDDSGKTAFVNPGDVGVIKIGKYSDSHSFITINSFKYKIAGEKDYEYVYELNLLCTYKEPENPECNQVSNS
jgi:hypothetical protein